MPDSNKFDLNLEHSKTLDIISKFCSAASALVDAGKMPAVHAAMLAFLAEIDEELKKVDLLLQ